MPRPRHRSFSLPATWLSSSTAQLATLVVVGALGAGALAATSPATPAGASTLAAASGARSSTSYRADAPRVRRASHAKPAAQPAHAKPAHKPAHRARSSRAVARPAGPWQPTGVGMWLYEWRHTNHGNPTSIVRRARHADLSTLYLRTGSSWDGLNGDRHLQQLLRATKGTRIRVVAWDFPRLRRPQIDAMRLVRAARITAAGQRVAAVAPDIETPSEGTFNAGWRVALYLKTLQQHLPTGVSVLTAVPWPSRFRIGDYPYGIVAAHSDVLIPMAYWYNNPPALVTARSISYLRRYHRPVAPAGQGYDGKLDVPGLRHNNLRRQLPVFLLTAHRAGVRAVSVWSWQSAPRDVWRAMQRNAHLFRASH